MKKLLIIFLIVLGFYAQAQTGRVVTQTPSNGHLTVRINGVCYVDDETKPFTGKFVERGYKNELTRETSYKNGKLHGEAIVYSYYRDSMYVKSKAYYENDYQVGRFIEYWGFGHKKVECFYNKNGQLHGKYISYEDYSGEIETKGNYINGKKDSTWVSYYGGLKLKEVSNYKMDKLNGISTRFYESGQKQSEANYKNDNIDGKEERWLKDGTLLYVAHYKNGQLHGKEINYFSNGKVEIERNYFNGAKKGKFVWYNEDGSIKEETTFN